MVTARLDGKGRVSIPAELRRQLGLESGDEVKIERDGKRLVIEAEPPQIRFVNSRGGWKKNPFPTAEEALFGT